jgi:hypothetical protein
MSARAQHGSVALGLTVALLLTACSHDIPTSVATASPSLPAMPDVRVDHLHGTTTSLVFDDVVKEAQHPDLFSQALTAAGFIGGQDRTLTGGRGEFSRVVIRSWSFGSEAGAASFLGWLQANVSELIPDASALSVDLPAGVVLLRHAVSGCCHEEVPIYLAAWQRGATVWTIRASGARIHTAPVVALVRSVEKET